MFVIEWLQFMSQNCHLSLQMSIYIRMLLNPRGPRCYSSSCLNLYIDHGFPCIDVDDGKEKKSPLVRVRGKIAYCQSSASRLLKRAL